MATEPELTVAVKNDLVRHMSAILGDLEFAGLASPLIDRIAINALALFTMDTLRVVWSLRRLKEKRTPVKSRTEFLLNLITEAPKQMAEASAPERRAEQLQVFLHAMSVILEQAGVQEPRLMFSYKS